MLTLQRAAYITEAQAHHDVDLAPLRQLLTELTADLMTRKFSPLAGGTRLAVSWPPVACGCAKAHRPLQRSVGSPSFLTGRAKGSGAACSWPSMGGFRRV